MLSRSLSIGPGRRAQHALCLVHPSRLLTYGGYAGAVTFNPDTGVATTTLYDDWYQLDTRTWIW